MNKSSLPCAVSHFGKSFGADGWFSGTYSIEKSNRIYFYLINCADKRQNFNVRLYIPVEV
jgi:hypothetical protein